MIRRRGPGYLVLAIIYFSAYTIFLGETLIKIKGSAGIRKLELQFLVLSFTISTCITIPINVSANLANLLWLKPLSLLATFAACAATAWGISTHHVYNLRQSLIQILHYLIILSAVVLSQLIFYYSLGGPTLTAAGFIGIGFLTYIVGCGAALLSREWLDLDGKTTLDLARGEILERSRIDDKSRPLLDRLEEYLKDHCLAHSCKLLVGEESSPIFEALKLKTGHSDAETIVKSGWATPESLNRRRTNPAVATVRRLMEENALGLVICLPLGSPRPSTIVALGLKTNQWPYTYPEIQRVQNLAVLIDNILSHARLASEAALRAQIENLALMSRGLAHDLRNLITPVSAFLDHAGKGLKGESVENEVYLSARRSVRVMSEYVREALWFSERLEPKLERVSLASILESVREASSPRGQARGVRVTVGSSFTRWVVADSILLHRLLCNLVSNAIDASDDRSTVLLSAEESPGARVSIRVSDRGSGISPDTLKRIFEPYFTTKELGEEPRGFGLGLTIAQKIAHLHHGAIRVESRVGHGTDMILDLPIAPPIGSIPSRKPTAPPAVPTTQWQLPQSA